MAASAAAIVQQAKAWLGRKESDGTHKEIIDVYNSHKPLARSYPLKYEDAWCAGFVSAVAIKCGATNIIPTEVSCSKMIELFKKLGGWVESDAHVPAPGEIVFYDWEDSGNGDNKEDPNHVGIVSEVDGESFTVIEGNKSDAVGMRTMLINGKYIRGFGVPKYVSEGVSSYLIYTVQKGDTLQKIARFYGLTVKDIQACNVAKLSNPDKIQVGWELNIPIPIVSEETPQPSESLETVNYYAIGKRLIACIEDIRNLESYKELIAVIDETGD